jgi:RND family efflux transporter MFP subunit
MAVWKQVLVSLVIVVLALAGWARFFPGASDVLERWGMDWALAAVQKQDGLLHESGRRGDLGGQRAMGPVRVVAAPVAHATVNDRLSAIGTGRADRSVLVTPYTSGRLTEVLVESGGAVEAGEVIAQLDSEAEEIALDRASIALEDAEARLTRITALRSSNTVTAVQVTEAELAVQNARLALRDAELALDRRSIRAPIAGVVGIIPVTAGNYVTAAQTEIATIDDRSHIIIDFWVPERYAGAISIGSALTATSIARSNEVYEGTVSAIDNRIDEQSRTLRVQARLANPDDTLRAGMSFQVAMRFPGDTYPAVDPLAIQWGTEGAFVWAIRDGRAERTPVRIVQRNTDTVLVDAPLLEGETVVTEGIHAVRHGMAVEPSDLASDIPASESAIGLPGRASGS